MLLLDGGQELPGFRCYKHRARIFFAPLNARGVAWCGSHTTGLHVRLPVSLGWLSFVLSIRSVPLSDRW